MSLFLSSFSNCHAQRVPQRVTYNSAFCQSSNAEQVLELVELRCGLGGGGAGRGGAANMNSSDGDSRTSKKQKQKQKQKQEKRQRQKKSKKKAAQAKRRDATRNWLKVELAKSADRLN